MRSGIAFEDLQRGFGHDDPDLLVWRASSALMNPRITPERLERERRRDPIRFQREYEAEFIDDLSACFEFAALQACIDVGVREHPPQSGVSYLAFCDSASGERKGNDAFTLGIAHAEQDRTVLDLMRAWSPFNPSGVIAEIADLLKKRYACDADRSAMRRAGAALSDPRQHGGFGIRVRHARHQTIGRIRALWKFTERSFSVPVAHSLLRR